MIATLDRPEKRNAIDQEMIDALHALCGSLEADPRTLILTGSGGVFAAGADIAQLRERTAEDARRGINAAAFIRANMPLGRGGTLTEQDAWDVALFMNGHERPQDPRYTGDVAETRKRFHDDPNSPYGTVVNGHLLGSAASRR